MSADETPEIRLKRLRMRSWRRGTREMDLLLGPFADGPLADLPEAAFADYEAFLEENDQDLYLWVSKARGHPARYDDLIRRIAAFHGIG
jgi:antitoxin CptB